MSMIKASFETTIGEDDLDVTVEFGYCHDSDEQGAFTETELYKVYITADTSKTDIQCLCWKLDLNLSEEADKDGQSRKENDDEDRAAAHSRDREEY